MRVTRSIRLDDREQARVKAASAEAGIPTATFLREAAVEVADLVLRGTWQPQRLGQQGGRVVLFHRREEQTNGRES